MRRIAPLLLVVAALPLIAAAPKADAPALLLNDANFDPALLLPPPPADDSQLGREEMAELRRIEKVRTPAEVARAKADDATKSVTIFAEAVGPAFDLARLPETKALFQIVRAEEKAAADRAKAHFRRNRPWIVDPKIGACSRDDEAWSAYPSGHTTMGYSMGAVLARLIPGRAPAIMARAAAYAHNRLVCEVHRASDVTAGQAYGMMVAERLMEQPSFHAQFEAARRELQQAGLN